MGVEEIHVTSSLSRKVEEIVTDCELKVEMECSGEKRIERILGRDVIACQHKINEWILK